MRVAFCNFYPHRILQFKSPKFRILKNTKKVWRYDGWLSKNLASIGLPVSEKSSFMGCDDDDDDSDKKMTDACYNRLGVTNA